MSLVITHPSIPQVPTILSMSGSPPKGESPTTTIDVRMYQWGRLSAGSCAAIFDAIERSGPYGKG